MVCLSSQLSDSDKIQIKTLVNNAFGQGYFDESLFLNENTAYWFLEKQNDDIIGLSLILLQSKIELELIDYLMHFPDISRFAYKKYSVVQASQRRRGIAKKLTKRAISFLTGKVEIIYSTVWKNISSEGIRRVLQNHDFIKIRDLFSHWGNDSIKRKYTCHGCKSSPCICDAELWIRQL